MDPEEAPSAQVSGDLSSSSSSGVEEEHAADANNREPPADDEAPENKRARVDEQPFGEEAVVITDGFGEVVLVNIVGWDGGQHTPAQFQTSSLVTDE